MPVRSFFSYVLFIHPGKYTALQRPALRRSHGAAAESVEPGIRLLPAPNLIEHVALGARVVMTRNSKPVAELIPMPHEQPRPVSGSAKGQVVILGNFDEPHEEFLVS